MDELRSGSSERVDAIIIGAGVSGIYALYRLRKLGLNCVLLEAGSGPGGTWYWNRYPGARFDSESYTYGYSFSKELLQEWDWSEHFAAQPETLSYLNHVVDRFDLRRHMRFNARVAEARYDGSTGSWLTTTEEGDVFRSQFLITAIGMLSAATLPRIPGIERFQGVACHTYDWPEEGVDLAGKRVGVIGTGATGVQVISEIAREVDELTVFQRRPNWCAPLNNSKIDDAKLAQIKASYDQIFAKMSETPGSFIHDVDRRKMSDLSAHERREFWEKLYKEPGFGIWHGNFVETFVDEEANRELSDFIAEKIRSRVHDPRVAEQLIPKDHGFGTRRVPLETNYYEAYNRDNVRLVDLKATPIAEINETGVSTREAQFDLDVLIFATGFDAITGAFDRIEIIGADGQRLADKWARGPETYLGVQVCGFPNLFCVAGPQSASVASNFPPTIEYSVDWLTNLITHVRDQEISVVEVSRAAEKSWVEEIKLGYEGVLLAKAASWFTGYNSNVDGHDTLRHMLFLGGAPTYRETLDEIAASGYPGFVFRQSSNARSPLIRKQVTSS